jgi:hypothetical protein
MRNLWIWIAIGVLGGVAGYAVLPDEGLRIRQDLFREIQPVALANCTLERFGEPHDGGYLVCANLLNGVQSGYSYGISGYDGWGCGISERLRVKVHEYDCFDTRPPACPAGQLVFHPDCIGATRVEDGRRFDTLANQIAANGDSGRNLIVKIDVEGAEWDAFLTVEDAVFDRIDQLVVEFHGVQDPRFVSALRRLNEHFYPVHLHFNNNACLPEAVPFPSLAYEVLFVNKRIAVLDPRGTPSGLSPLDALNNPGVPDCQGSGR